jgi:hypothetical protein
MKKTSLTHPLQIATISAGSKFGRVGITFCPGKYDRHAMSGEWNRDLALDLNTIRDWGAAAVVTLLEPKELALLRVENLGEEVLRRNMVWFHLPIGKQPKRGLKTRAQNACAAGTCRRLQRSSATAIAGGTTAILRGTSRMTLVGWACRWRRNHVARERPAASQGWSS